MGRKGWSSVATPAGWFEVIRGPRPPSVQWPKGNGKFDDTGLKPEETSPWPLAGCRTDWSLEERRSRCPTSRFSINEGPQFGTALAVLGPEESVAKTEIAGALKRVREQEVASVRDPDKVVAAREKVARSCAERCTIAASGRTDPSEGSIHRTVPEAHRPLRRGACSRNNEIGGE